MGYIAHDAAIAVTFDKSIIEQLAEFKERLDRDHPDISPFFVGPIVTVNYDSVYAFLPDGSKEGWGLSKTAQKLREEFVEITRGTLDEDDGDSYWEGGDVVSVRFGGDFGSDYGTKVIFTTDRSTPVLT